MLLAASYQAKSGQCHRGSRETKYPVLAVSALAKRLTALDSRLNIE